MSELTRRSTLKQATTLALAGSLIATAVHAESTSAALAVTDPDLERASRSPQAYMFDEQVTFKLEGDRHSRDLYITSAKDAQGKKARVRVPRGGHADLSG